MKLHIAIKKAEANPLLSFYIIESHRRLNVIAESEWHQADYIPYKNMDYIHAKRDDMRRTAMIYHCIRNE